MKAITRARRELQEQLDQAGGGWEVSEMWRGELEIRRSGREPYTWLGWGWRSKARPAIRIGRERGAWGVFLGSERHYSREELYCADELDQAAKVAASLALEVARLDNLFLQIASRRSHLLPWLVADWSLAPWVELDGYDLSISIRPIWTGKRWRWEGLEDPINLREGLLIEQIRANVRLSWQERSTFLDMLAELGLTGLGNSIKLVRKLKVKR